MEDARSLSLITARNEYQKYLVYLLFPCIYQGMKSLWDGAKDSSSPSRVYQTFQDRCKLVRKWNNDIIENEYQRIVKKTNCTWLEDLINHVFLLNTEILAAYHPQGGRPNVKLKLPKGEKFVHHCYMECARAFYQDVALMEDRVEVKSKMEQARNLKKANALIKECIEQTITNMLPIENIIKQKDSEAEDAIPMGNLFAFAPHHMPQAAVPQPMTPPSTYMPPIQTPQPVETFAPPPQQPPSPPPVQETEKTSQFDPDSLFDDEYAPKEPQPTQDVALQHFRAPEEAEAQPLHEDVGIPAAEVKNDDFKIIHLEQNAYKKRPSSRKSASDNESRDEKSEFEIRETASAPASELPTLREKRDSEHVNLDVMSTDNALMPMKSNEEEDNRSTIPVPPLTSFDSMNFFDD